MRIMAAILALGALIALVIVFHGETASQEKRLADGSCLRIQEVTVGKNLSRTFFFGNRVQRFLGRITPEWLGSRLPLSIRSKWLPDGSVSLYMSSDRQSCLFVVTARSDRPAAGELGLKLLVVGDEHGQGTNASECLTTVDAWNRFQGWAVEDFPKNSRTLQLRCLASGPDGGLVEAAQFTISNPAYGQQ
jgi:hypothetical protein